MNLFRLDGRRALITGSSQGLGLMFARALAGAGAEVILNGRDAEKLEKTREAMRAEGMDAHAFAFDITDRHAVEAAVETIENQSGPMDILVNNAGMNRRAPLEDFTLEDWQAVMDLNVTAMFSVSQVVGRRMISRRCGKIINIASLLSAAARPTIPAYTVSKGAVASLTQSLAVEWAKYNIQVNAIAPGYFATELNATLKANPDFDKWVCQRTPSGRWGEPEELIGAAVFLASEATSYMTGQTIFIDGGWRAAL